MGDKDKKHTVVEYDGPKDTLAERQRSAEQWIGGVIERYLEEHGPVSISELSTFTQVLADKVWGMPLADHQDYIPDLEVAVDAARKRFSSDQLTTLSKLMVSVSKGLTPLETDDIDAIFNISYSGGPEQELWHAANISVAACHFDTFSDDAKFAARVGFEIGFLHRDQWWRENHETAAAIHYEQVEARKKGSPKGGDRTRERYENLRLSILTYLPDAIAEVGLVFAGQPTSIQAEKIRELALRDDPDKYVGPRGGQLGSRWFRNSLEYLKAGREFGEALAAAFPKSP